MQTPVRFYITQSDDQPVVHTVPVAIRHPVPVAVVESGSRASAESNTSPNSTDTSTIKTINKTPRRARLSKIVRAATHRDAGRHS